MRRAAFTLIELLVIIAIMGTMVTVGVVSLNSSRSATRVFAAGRDVMAMIRRARSLALVTQKPVVLSYSNEKLEDAACVKVEIRAERLFAQKKAQERVMNLAGDVVVEAVADDGEAAAGETLEDVLSPERIPEDVVKGLKIKVVDESDTLNLPENETRRSKISIFSTADSVSRTLTSASVTTNATAEVEGEGEVEGSSLQVAFAANGTVNPPHRLWIYREESTPEKGICIRVDRFGEPKCEDFD